MDKLDIPGSKREYINEKVVTALFFDYNGKELSSYIKMFRSEFSGIIDYLKGIKKDNYKYLVPFLQRAESKFVIEKVVGNFIKQYKGRGEFISSVHDSILAKYNMLDEAEQLMAECFRGERINAQLSVKVFQG